MINMDISIHAPVKGATCRRSIRSSYQTYFNPRTREGCDLKEYLRMDADITISIHAPVKGATCIAGVDPVWPRAISIHAPVKGATPC